MNIFKPATYAETIRKKAASLNGVDTVISDYLTMLEECPPRMSPRRRAIERQMPQLQLLRHQADVKAQREHATGLIQEQRRDVAKLIKTMESALRDRQATSADRAQVVQRRREQLTSIVAMLEKENDAAKAERADAIAALQRAVAEGDTAAEAAASDACAAADRRIAQLGQGHTLVLRREAHEGELRNALDSEREALEAEGAARQALSEALLESAAVELDAARAVMIGAEVAFASAHAAAGSPQRHSNFRFGDVYVADPRRVPGALPAGEQPGWNGWLSARIVASQVGSACVDWSAFDVNPRELPLAQEDTSPRIGQPDELPDARELAATDR